MAQVPGPLPPTGEIRVGFWDPGRGLATGGTWGWKIILSLSPSFTSRWHSVSLSNSDHHKAECSLLGPRSTWPEGVLGTSRGHSKGTEMGWAAPTSAFCTHLQELHHVQLGVSFLLFCRGLAEQLRRVHLVPLVVLSYKPSPGNTESHHSS